MTRDELIRLEELLLKFLVEEAGAKAGDAIPQILRDVRFKKRWAD